MYFRIIYTPIKVPIYIHFVILFIVIHLMLFIFKKNRQLHDLKKMFLKFVGVAEHFTTIPLK